MKKIALPFGRTSLEVRVPEQKLVGIFRPKSRPPVPDLSRALRQAVRNPEGTPPLFELAANVGTVAIVVDDATRAVPTRLLLNVLINELQQSGLELSRIHVIVATGLHRPLSKEEEAAVMGPWNGRVRLESHDARNTERLLRLGRTSLGTEIWLNRAFLESDLKILTGDVEFHQFCGFGGGAKSIYPGLADAGAIRSSHSRLEWPGTGPGRDKGNPVRQEMDEVGRMAGANFLLCTVLDPDHRVVFVRAGEVTRSFQAACEVVREIYHCPVPALADLVLASAGGHPRDATLYQAQKAIATATRVVRPGGSVAVVAACAEGSGSGRFEEWMERAFRPVDVMARLRENFEMGGHKAFQIARDVEKASVHLLSELPPGKVRSWFLRPLCGVQDIQELVARAESITVLPEAMLTLAEPAWSMESGTSGDTGAVAPDDGYDPTNRPS